VAVRQKWRIAKDQRQAEKGREAAIKRVDQRRREEDDRLFKEKEVERAKGMSGKEKVVFDGSRLAEMHVEWAMDPALTKIGGRFRYPLNEEFSSRVRAVLMRAYDAGAWPTWDAEVMKLQRLGRLMSLLRRSAKAKIESEIVRAGVSAYEGVVQGKMDEISNQLRERFTEESFNAVKTILQRVVSSDSSRLPSLFLGRAVQDVSSLPTLEDMVAKTTRLEIR
jgi:hypothetical protein